MRRTVSGPGGNHRSGDRQAGVFGARLRHHGACTGGRGAAPEQVSAHGEFLPVACRRRRRRHLIAVTDASLSRTLTEQLASLRALARQLVTDPHAADDAVQDACLAMLRRRGDVRSARGWLGRVLANAARQRARGDARRRERERVAFERREALGAPVEPDLERHARLLRHVTALPDRQRAVVTMHFWRGASVAEIAAATGTSARAVRDRLQAAMAELRRRLDADEGGRAAWVLPLAASCGVTSGSPVASAGAARTAAQLAATCIPLAPLFMQAKLLITGGLLLAAVTVFAFWSQRPDQAPLPPHNESHAPRVAAAADPHEASAGAAAASGTERTEARPRAESPEQPGAAPPERLRGVVADIGGARVAGVAIAFDPAGAEPHGDAVVSDEHGVFVLPWPEHGGALTSVDARWAAVRRHHVDGHRGNPEDVVVVVAESRDYAGTVVDPHGAPVAGARVAVDLAEVQRAVVVDGSALQLPHDLVWTNSDERGRFVFRGVGYLPGAVLEARRSPFGGTTVPLPSVSTDNLLLELAPPVPLDAVHGIVLDATGGPVEGARVSVGALAASTARDGSFRVVWRDGQRPCFVHAVAAGLGVAGAELHEGPDEPGWHPDRPVLLRLPAEPPRLRGRVVDADGAPVTGARVWTPDLTFFGQVVQDVEGHQVYAESSVEEQFGGPGGGRFEFATRTDDDGAFELVGVLPRDYALFAIDPHSLAAAGPIAARAGEPVELRLERARARRIAGRLTTPDGAPLAGVGVHTSRALAWQRPERHPDPWHGSPLLPPKAATGRFGPQTKTDSDGRFELPPCVVDGVSLAFDGEAVFLPRPYTIAPDDDPEDLRIERAARAAFRVVLGSRTADAYSLLDGAGRHRPMFVRSEGMLLSVPRVAFAEGIAPVATSEAGSATLVLWRGGDELDRLEVELLPGDVHEIRL